MHSPEIHNLHVATSEKTVSYLDIIRQVHIYRELGPYIWGAYNTKILRQACLFQYCKT